MKKVSRIEYCASFEPLQSGMGQDGESKILFPTMKPLDTDKKAFCRDICLSKYDARTIKEVFKQ